MKTLVFGIACAAVLASAGVANAYTCKERGDLCIRFGGNYANCHAHRRLDACERTGIYTAPSGRSFPADRGKRKK